MARKPDGLFKALQIPESRPQNPMAQKNQLMTNMGMQAMQQRLTGAKKNKPMKPPMPRAPKMKMGGSKVG